MNTATRKALYERQGPMTPAKRRRLVKNAAHNADGIVIRDDGMGFSPAMQGYRELVEVLRPIDMAEAF